MFFPILLCTQIILKANNTFRFFNRLTIKGVSPVETHSSHATLSSAAHIVVYMSDSFLMAHIFVFFLVFQSTETSPASSLQSLPISPCSEKSLPFKVTEGGRLCVAMQMHGAVLCACLSQRKQYLLSAQRVARATFQPDVIAACR